MDSKLLIEPDDCEFVSVNENCRVRLTCLSVYTSVLAGHDNSSWFTVRLNILTQLTTVSVTSQRILRKDQFARQALSDRAYRR